MKRLLSVLLLILLAIVIYYFRPAAPEPPLTPTSPASVQPTPTPTSVATPTPVPPPVQPAPTEPPPPVQPANASALFVDPVTPAVYELPSGALATWRQHAGHKPALVLFSAHPFLDPLPTEEGQNIVAFVKTAAPRELVRRGRSLVPDPVLTSPQTVSAAIAAGLFSEFIYVQPTTRPIDKFSLPDFQKKAFAAGFLTDQEALALTMKDGVISGTVRGLPFRAVHPEALPQLAKPVIVHIDLGYFKDLFVNDIKTPVYDLIYHTLVAIRTSDWPTIAVTLSYSNQEAEFSLATRFVISNLADLLERPEWTAGGTPITWEMRAKASKARAMFAETEARELIEQAAAASPRDPDVLYELSQLRFIQKRADEGFKLLDRAVAIDPGYALAYIELATTGVEQKRLEKASELFSKAAKAFPDNPFIRIAQADLLIRQERGREALPLLRDLQALPWSPAFHPGVPGHLKEMQEVALEQK